MKRLSSPLIGLGCLMTMGGIAHAASPVSGALNVDNNYVVVVSQNGVNTPVSYGPSNFRQTMYFSTMVDDTPKALEDCAINIIAWGDGSPEQGLATIVYGDGGKVYSGGPNITVYNSQISSRNVPGIPPQFFYTGDPPTQAEIDTMIGNAVFTAPYEIPGTVTGGTNPWGPVSYAAGYMNGVPAGDLQWIWDTSNMSGPITFKVFSIPCRAVVTPKKPTPPGPAPMNGEHFQCYGVEQRYQQEGDLDKFVVEDQFGSAVIGLGKPVMLCNPSFKNHKNKEFPIQRPERHLVCYELDTNQSVKGQDLEIENQFSKIGVTSNQRELFCVPSSKKHVDFEQLNYQPGKGDEVLGGRKK